MLKVQIADGNDEFRMSLEERLGADFLVRSTASGKQTMDTLCSFQPDILVLDVMLPGQDGISLLRQMDTLKFKPMTLAITCLLNDYVVGSLNRLGVSYIMMKPCDMYAVTARVRDFADYLTGHDRGHCGRTAGDMLDNLGVSRAHKGYRCLEFAIPAFAEDSGQSVTKELYVAVAKDCDGQPKQVERAMRSAILAAWEKRDDRVWSGYFLPDAHGRIPRPTNRHFISRLAELLGK